jgi:hypothetical protein
MTSLVTTKLGTKENPHPYKKGQKRNEGEYYLNENGEIRFFKWGKMNKCNRNFGMESQRISYSEISDRFMNSQSTLLWDENDHKEKYKNNKTRIPYICGFCGKTSDCSWMILVDRERKGNPIVCEPCGRKVAGKKARATYNDLCDIIKNSDYILLWNEEQYNKMYSGATDINIPFKSETCGHDFITSRTGMISRIRREQTKCYDCNCVTGHAKGVWKKFYNEETGEYQCKVCKIWKNLQDNYYKPNRDHYLHTCNDCEKIKRDNKILNLSEMDFINKLVRDCIQRHNMRVKKGRKFKSELDIIPEYILKLLEKTDNTCVRTGVKLVLKINADPNFQCSIDRIDSNDTYTESNIQLVSTRYNRSKMNNNDEDFIKFCKLVAEHNK